MKSTKPLVAVDCDTLLYASTAACEERSIEVLHEPTGKTKEFKNRTEFKELIQHIHGSVINFCCDKLLQASIVDSV